MLDRLAALESENTRLAVALREAAAGEESVCRADLASDERLAIASDLEEAFTAPAAALGEGHVDEDAPVRDCDQAHEPADICPETSDGYHCGDWHDGGRCGACGLYGPDPACDEVLDEGGTKVNCWLGQDPHDWHEGEFMGAVYRWEHGSRAYQVTGILGDPDELATMPDPEDNERGQS